MAGQIKVEYGRFEQRATTLSKHNQTLLDELHEIKDLINSLAGGWESNSAARIREKITAMEPRFEDYYNVVDNYVKFIRNTAQSYEATEKTNTSNADQFV